MNTNGNAVQNGSQSKILWWILGAILSPLILATLNTVQTTVNRVSALEAEFVAVKHQLGNIEHKLDRLVERGN